MCCTDRTQDSESSHPKLIVRSLFDSENQLHHFTNFSTLAPMCQPESPSLVLVINDTKLLMPCVKCFELGISNTCDEGVCGKEWWPQDHKEMVHGQEMMIMVVMHIK
jgi:hypothetical protein